MHRLLSKEDEESSPSEEMNYWCKRFNLRDTFVNNMQEPPKYNRLLIFSYTQVQQLN